jgi:hypothetical protein
MTVDRPEARLVEDFHGFGLAFAGYCNACILAIAREEESHYGQAEGKGGKKGSAGPEQKAKSAAKKFLK